MFKKGFGQNGQRERLLITCSMICIDCQRQNRCQIKIKIDENIMTS